MKNITVLLVATMVLATFECLAQPFEVGSNVAGAGIGLGGSFGLGRYGSATPGISVQYEHGLVDGPGPGVISLGGYLGTKSYRYDGRYDGFWYKERWRYTILGVRSAYHYTGLPIDELDVYGGAMLSYNILSYKYSDNDPLFNYHDGTYGSHLGFSIYVGGRYYLMENVAAFAELGYGVSYLTLGASVKF